MSISEQRRDPNSLHREVSPSFGPADQPRLHTRRDGLVALWSASRLEKSWCQKQQRMETIAIEHLVPRPSCNNQDYREPNKFEKAKANAVPANSILRLCSIPARVAVGCLKWSAQDASHLQQYLLGLLRRRMHLSATYLTSQGIKICTHAPYDLCAEQCD